MALTAEQYNFTPSTMAGQHFTALERTRRGTVEIRLSNAKDVVSVDHSEDTGLVCYALKDGSRLASMAHRRMANHLFAVDPTLPESLYCYAEWLGGALPSQLDWINGHLRALRQGPVAYEKRRFAHRTGPGARFEDLLKSYANTALWDQLPEDLNPDMFGCYGSGGSGWEITVHGEYLSQSFQISHEDILVWMWTQNQPSN